MSKNNEAKIVVSGIQPTGRLHIGNYLGAIKNWLEIQQNPGYRCFFSIADWHSMTIDYDPNQKRQQILELAADLLALGIDPAKVTLFAQSDVLDHAELAWIFNCLTPMAELERMTQYKDKALRNKENANAGLLTYPILQAADILMYKGELVPVGTDQVQHVELTRDIAKWFNRKFCQTPELLSTPKGQFPVNSKEDVEKILKKTGGPGTLVSNGLNIFPETKPLLTKSAKVRSLTEPTAKMSKSHGEKSCLFLTDSPEEILDKVKKVPTEATGELKMTEQEVDESIADLAGREPDEYLKGMAGVWNLIGLVRQFGTPEEAAQIMTNQPIRYGDLKKRAAELVAAHFGEFRAKRADLLAQPEQIEAVLATGAEQARAVARETMREVRDLVGLGQRRHR